MLIISGVVIEGRQKGRELGYPTANIILTMAIPSGIYAATTEVNGKKYMGAVFINEYMNLFEVYLLDFSGDLYGQELRVELKEKIREVEKFENEESLKKQIAKDVERVRKLSH